MSSGALRRRLAELEAGPTAAPQRGPVEIVRVRVVEGFSTELDGLPLYGTAGSVLDVPRKFAEITRGLVEPVAADTPVHIVQPAGGWPR
jgi:hypothetical protein